MQTIFGETLNPINAWKSWRYKVKFNKSHPEYFPFDGITVFSGKQGDGKTLSMVVHASYLAKYFPQTKIISNIKLTYIPHIPLHDFSELPDLIKENQNGYAGLIILIDEFQNEMDATESKNVTIPLLTEITQLRKQRMHIICTSQVFGRLIKPVRQQFKQVVLCRCYGKVLQVNRYGSSYDTVEVDGKLTMNNSSVNMWFHKPENYEAYDTYEKVDRSMRKDRNHNISRELVDSYDYIALESLQVKNMMKNRRLSKAIANVAWFDLTNKITYKMAEKQGQVVRIDKFFPSSKTCSCCGNVKDTLSLSERTYNCEACGFTEDRDINAAKNILAASKSY